MKDIIWRFKSEKDYNVFLNDLRQDNKSGDPYMEEIENDNNIVFTFVDSEIFNQGGGGTI